MYTGVVLGRYGCIEKKLPVRGVEWDAVTSGELI